MVLHLLSCFCNPRANVLQLFPILANRKNKAETCLKIDYWPRGSLLFFCLQTNENQQLLVPTEFSEYVYLLLSSSRFAFRMCEVETNNARTDGKMMTLKKFEPSFPIDPRIFFFFFSTSSSPMLIWPQALRHTTNQCSTEK